ncbi:MAG TPA: hypothetical protein VK020_00910, partial [Microlunatus sp.]|nr:hypothetical protein [Microlunatus sp.]
MEINLDGILLVGAVVMIAAIIAARLGARIGLPSLLLFLGLGMLMGDSVLGLQFNDAGLAHALGFGALVLILAEGGLTTRWHEIKPAIGVAGGAGHRRHLHQRRTDGRVRPLRPWTGPVDRD